jgi:hypothetical protein
MIYSIWDQIKNIKNNKTIYFMISQVVYISNGNLNNNNNSLLIKALKM